MNCGYLSIFLLKILWIFLIWLRDDIETNPDTNSYRYDEIRRLLKQYDKKLKTIHLNRQSLQRKRMSLKQPLSDFNDNTVKGLSETRLVKANDVNPLDIDSKKLFFFRCDRNARETKNQRWGIMLIPKALNTKERNDLRAISNYFEGLWIEI